MPTKPVTEHMSNAVCAQLLHRAALSAVLAIVLCSLRIVGPHPAVAYEAKTPTASAGNTHLQKDGENAESSSTKPTQVTEASAGSNLLTSAVAEFQNNRSNAAWAAFAEAFKSYITANPSPTSEELKASKLIDVGLTCIQQPSLKLWFFPQVNESHGLFLQWPHVVSSKSKATGSRTTAITTLVQYLPLPTGVTLKDGRLLTFACVSDKQRSTTAAAGTPGKPIKSKSKSKSSRRNLTVHRATAPAPSKFLVLAGTKQPGNALWLESYKLTAGQWQQSSSPLSKIPPFLLGSLSGDISFTGNDLVLTASPSGNRETRNPLVANSGKNKKPDFSVYKLSLRLINGHYLLDGQGQADTAYGTITQFLQAEQKGRIDLAKAWLADPSVASIPQYLKLFNQGSLSNFRLISLLSPCSLYRYRLITFGKDDLIFDVGRLKDKDKDQWLIKAIFVAPSDLGWQKIAQSLPPIM